MLLKLSREPWSPVYTVTMPNGHTEEIPCEELVDWLTRRGAVGEGVEKAADTCWNFQQAQINIANWKEPPSQEDVRTAPSV